MLAKAPLTGAAPDRARTAPKPLQSYPVNPSQGNSNDDVWSCAVPPSEWPEWTDQLAFTTAAPRRKGGAR